MRATILIYVSFLLLPLEDFPFEKYGIWSNHSVSLLFMLLFFIINIDKIRIRRKNMKLIGLFAIVFLISFLFSVFKYNADFTGCLKELNSMITFIPYTFGMYLFYRNSSYLQKKRLISATVIGYIGMFLVGILQLLTNVMGSNALNDIWGYLIEDPRWLVEEGRLQFTLSEPSYFTYHFFCIILPLKKLVSDNYKKMYNIFLIMYSILGLFTFSSLYYICLIIYIVTKIFDNKENNIKKYLGICTIIICIVAVFIMLDSHLLKLTGNVYLIRFDDLYHRIAQNQFSFDNIGGDMSLSTRTTLLAIGILGFLRHPILGYGFGYGLEAYKDLISTVNPWWSKNSELMAMYSQRDYIFLGGIYTNLLCGAGIIGLIIIFYLCKDIVGSKFVNNSEKITFFILMLQTNLIGIIPAMIYWEYIRIITDFNSVE